ncbi:MAG: DUF5678 domain-containing protein, partial [Blastocatellia bacterium]
MTELTPEILYTAFQQMPPAAQQRFRELLAGEAAAVPVRVSGKRVPPPVPYKDRTREFEWLAQNANAYAGKWVALEGDQLIACGDDGVRVLREAREKGIDRPLLMQVEQA